MFSIGWLVYSQCFAWPRRRRPKCWWPWCSYRVRYCVRCTKCVILHHLASSCLILSCSSCIVLVQRPLFNVTKPSLSLPPPHYSLTLVMSCTSPYKLQTNSRSKSRRSRRKKTPPPHPAPPEHCSGCTWTAATRLVHAWFTWFTHASRACFLFAAHALVAPFLLP